MKPSKPTKNSQSKIFIDSSKIFVLDFRTQVETRFRTGDADLMTLKKPEDPEA